MSEKVVCLSVLISTELHKKLIELTETQKDRDLGDMVRKILSDRIINAEITGVIE